MTTALDSISIDYSHWMKAALSLAAQGAGFTHPNPMVGAIVLDEHGAQVGAGFHARAGEPHAEAAALKAAGPRARGGTLVVTLEPCCHEGRTPPCTDGILAAGIKRVVATHADPDVRVSGRGFDRLRQAGVLVITGVEADASRRLNRHYLHHRTTGRPWVTLKLGMSLDGRIADASGRSQWITSPACRRHAHALRALHDAILVGAGTALSDDPELSLHGAPGMPPRRFLLVGQRDLPRSLRLFAGEQPATTIGIDARADWVVAADARGWPDLGSVLTRLGQEGHTGLLVEGGGRVATALLSAHLVCRMVIYYGHLILGEGRSALEGIAFPLDSAPKLSEVDVESLEGGFVVSGLTER